MKNLFVLSTFLIFTLNLTAQHTTIEYDSDRDHRPHLLLLEDDNTDDEMARIWFKNSNDADNFWTLGARSKSGSFDFDNTLKQNFTVAFNRIQKFAISKDGEVRINASYILPTSDGAEGEVITTDGNGMLSWSKCCDEVIESVQEFHMLVNYNIPPSCSTKGNENGKIVFDSNKKKVRVCIDGKWKSIH